MYDDIIAKYSSLYNVPETWIRAVIQTESSGRAGIISADGGYGLMQLMPYTATALGYRGDTQGLLDPDTNIGLGTQLLAQLIGRYGNDAEKVYSAYNSGKPDAYLSNSSVANHVANFMRNLDSAVASAVQAFEDNPGPATSGLVVLILAFVALYYWKGKFL